MVTSVYTVLPCLRSMIVALLRPSVPPVLSAALAAVKTTVPKLDSATKLPPCSKSSTIHSAFWRHRTEPLGALRVWLTFLPVLTLVSETVPFVVEVATMSTWITLPALTAKLLKS